jgi:hypothetical protein
MTTEQKPASTKDYAVAAATQGKSDGPKGLPPSTPAAAKGKAEAKKGDSAEAKEKARAAQIKIGEGMQKIGSRVAGYFNTDHKKVADAKPAGPMQYRLMSVPSPSTQVNLGEWVKNPALAEIGAAFGYPGFSVTTAASHFTNVGGPSVFQGTGDVTQQGGARWTQFSEAWDASALKRITVTSGEGILIGSGTTTLPSSDFAKSIMVPTAGGALKPPVFDPAKLHKQVLDHASDSLNYVLKSTVTLSKARRELGMPMLPVPEVTVWQLLGLALHRAANKILEAKSKVEAIQKKLKASAEKAKKASEFLKKHHDQANEALDHYWSGLAAGAPFAGEAMAVVDQLDAAMAGKPVKMPSREALTKVLPSAALPDAPIPTGGGGFDGGGASSSWGDPGDGGNESDNRGRGGSFGGAGASSSWGDDSGAETPTAGSSVEDTPGAMSLAGDGGGGGGGGAGGGGESGGGESGGGVGKALVGAAGEALSGKKGAERLGKAANDLTDRANKHLAKQTDLDAKGDPSERKVKSLDFEKDGATFLSTTNQALDEGEVFVGEAKEQYAANKKNIDKLAELHAKVKAAKFDVDGDGHVTMKDAYAAMEAATAGAAQALDALANLCKPILALMDKLAAHLDNLAMTHIGGGKSARIYLSAADNLELGSSKKIHAYSVSGFDFETDKGGFRLQTAQSIALRSQDMGEFLAEKHLWLEGQKGAELASKGPTVLASRQGTAEVLGKTVRVGALESAATGRNKNAGELGGGYAQGKQHATELVHALATDRSIVQVGGKSPDGDKPVIAQDTPFYLSADKEGKVEIHAKDGGHLRLQVGKYVIQLKDDAIMIGHAAAPDKEPEARLKFHENGDILLETTKMIAIENKGNRIGFNDSDSAWVLPGSSTKIEMAKSGVKVKGTKINLG